MNEKKRIAVLGSTGSIGTQALDVIAQHPDLFTAEVLTANTSAEMLAQQAKRFNPDSVVIADESKYGQLKELLAGTDIKVFAGPQAICDVVELGNIDLVLVALVGFAGLMPTISAIKAHKAIALANKETLVVAGEKINELVAQNKVDFLPVDSEHSAIFQCLAGETCNPVEKILLTASGGPFRNMPKEQLQNVTVEQALAHPSWNMGSKITIDSATMMNKGFEVIEAKWLFGVTPQQIEVVVHPQSIVHSAVQFRDGAVKAQLGMPDMRIPIQYAFGYPRHLDLQSPRLDLAKLGQLTFSAPDTDKFPCLALAYEAIEREGTLPCVMNAANEVANLAFRNRRIGFTQIASTIEQTMAAMPFTEKPSIDCLLDTDREARAKANEIINRH